MTNGFRKFIITTAIATVCFNPSNILAKDFDFCESPSEATFTNLNSLSSATNQIKNFARNNFRTLFNKPKSQNVASRQINKPLPKKNTKPKNTNRPTAQQTANVLGIASIAGALVAAARGDTATAVNILDAGSKVVKSVQPQNSSQSNVGSSGNVASLSGNGRAFQQATQQASSLTCDSASSKNRVYQAKGKSASCTSYYLAVTLIACRAKVISAGTLESEIDNSINGAANAADSLSSTANYNATCGPF